MPVLLLIADDCCCRCCRSYWYNHGLLQPDKIVNAVLAVDHNTEENGCMRLLSRSHTLGRIEVPLPFSSNPFSSLPAASLPPSSPSTTAQHCTPAQPGRAEEGLHSYLPIFNLYNVSHCGQLLKWLVPGWPRQHGKFAGQMCADPVLVGEAMQIPGFELCRSTLHPQHLLSPTTILPRLLAV